MKFINVCAWEFLSDFLHAKMENFWSFCWQFLKIINRMLMIIRCLPNTLGNFFKCFNVIFRHAEPYLVWKPFVVNDLFSISWYWNLGKIFLQNRRKSSSIYNRKKKTPKSFLNVLSQKDKIFLQKRIKKNIKNNRSQLSSSLISLIPTHNEPKLRPKLHSWGRPLSGHIKPKKC
jgi:hypothetical protein